MVGYLKIPLYILQFAACYFWFRITRSNRRSHARTLFLIGSNYGNRIDENASALYRYMKSQGVEVYLITNRAENGGIRRGSMKSFYLYFRSKAVYFTHSFSDILPYMHKLSFLPDLASSPCRVFMQHGVIGLKDRNSKISIRNYVLSLDKSFDYMLVSSRWEKDLVGSFGIKENKLLVTGLPRFDNLLQCSSSQNNIMVFLTWQNYRVYRDKLNDILSVIASKLNIEKTGVCGDVVVRHHPMMRLKGNEKESIQETICRCSLLITDDSSVAWDFFYKKGNVLFYKPSQWLIRQEGMHNIICHDKKSLSQKISSCTERGAQLDLYKFAFVDENNCKRAYDSTVLR